MTLKAETVVAPEIVTGANKGGGRPKNVKKSIVNAEGGATVAVKKGRERPKAVQTRAALKAGGADSSSRLTKKGTPKKSQEWYKTYIMNILSEAAPVVEVHLGAKKGRGRLKAVNRPAGFKVAAAVGAGWKKKSTGKKSQEWYKTYISMILMQEQESSPCPPVHRCPVHGDEPCT